MKSDENSENALGTAGREPSRRGRPATASIVLALAGLFLWSSKVVADEDSKNRCSNLGWIHVVSNKSREAKLFAEIVAVGQKSSKRPFDSAAVVQLLSACLDAWRASEAAADEDAPPILAKIRVAIDSDRATARIGIDDEPAFALPLTSRGEDLAETMIRKVLRQSGLEGERRRDAENALWFLWIESYVRSLGQRHNHYRYADEIAKDAVQSLGRRYAVGFDAVFRDGKAYADQIVDETLKARGLDVGAEIATLDTRPVADLSTPELSRYWLSLVPFQYQVTGVNGDKPFRIAAESLPRRYRTITWATRGDLAYLHISEFAKESIIELRRVLRAIEREGIQGLVLDLRSNPGGLSSPGMSDCFLKPGQATLSFRVFETGKEYDVDGTVDYHGIPLAVLVDRNTASMAEAFAAAIQVHKRGTIVGTATFGKGVGQSVHKILDEGTLHLVERIYFYPGTRNSWDGVGITPDVVVEPADGDAERIEALLESDTPSLENPERLDAALRKAFEILEAHP